MSRSRILIRHNCFSDNGFVEIRQRYVSQQSISELVMASLRTSIDGGARISTFAPPIRNPTFTVKANGIEHWSC